VRASVLVALSIASAGCQQLFGLDDVVYDAPPDAPPCSPLSVATGRGHSCAVDYRGRISCWGINDFHQVATVDAAFVLTPTELVLAGSAADVAAGRSHSCARLDDGAVWCWGQNAHGELGTGASSTEMAPRLVTGIPPSAEISAGGYHTCSRSAADGGIWCWGTNGEKETGVDGGETCSTGEPCTTPHLVSGTEGAKRVLAGHRYTCMIDKDDHVACWGRNRSSQLGDLSPTRATPVVVSQLDSVLDVATSGRTTCALETDGDVKCWGRGVNGQLATGEYDDVTTPVATRVTNARDIALGGYGGCATAVDGSVSCWGSFDGGEGQLVSTAEPRTSLLVNPSQLETGYYHTCAIAQGTVQCFGDNMWGQLGRGERGVIGTPRATPATGADLVGVGFNHACARVGSAVQCWGGNDLGQAGNSDTIRRYEPSTVATGLSAVSGLSVGYQRSCAWGGGQAACWGGGQSGALGNGAETRAAGATAVTVAQDIASAAVGRDHTCFLTSTSGGPKVICAGFNSHGQLGTDPATPQSYSGVTVPGLPSTVTQIAAGGEFNCALGGGIVYCWGRNTNGQLGDGTTTDHSTPTLINSLVSVAEIHAGASFACARKTSGELYCWGRNGTGELGDGGTADSVVPKQVVMPNGEAVVTFSTGERTTCARTVGGNVYCWGNGALGQTGTGLDQFPSTPVFASEWQNASALANGDHGTCAVVAGQVRCTGVWAIVATGDRSESVPTSVSLGGDACAQ